MEIESFNPYHIGIKLKAINAPVLKNDIRNILKDNPDYKITEEPKTQFIQYGNETIATKNTVSIVYNNTARALNIIGDTPTNAKEVFDEIISIINEELKYEIPSIVQFYELVVGVIIHTENDPLEKIPSMTNKNFDIFEQETNAEVRNITLFSKNKEASDFEILEVMIDPYLNSPHSRYFIRVTFRSPEKEKIERFHEKFEEKMIELLQNVESE